MVEAKSFPPDFLMEQREEGTRGVSWECRIRRASWSLVRAELDLPTERPVPKEQRRQDFPLAVQILSRGEGQN